jgi:septum site-determining protein MinC
MASDSDRPFELEGVVTALNVLRLRSGDLSAITAALNRRIAKTPGLFRGAPVVVDLSALEPEPVATQAGMFPPAQSAPPPLPFELAALLAMLRDKGLVPVGVRARGSQWLQQATAAGLGVIELDRTPPPRKPKPTEAPAPTAETAVSTTPALAPAAPASSAPTSSASTSAPPPSSSQPPGEMFALTLTQPLRSGQVVYAEGRDAVALAAVHAGAELMADGNIHVYGPLRGRALAGASGSEDARIFCQRLEADLISIAGVYLHSDALPADKRGKPVQVALRDGQLVVTDLSS